MDVVVESEIASLESSGSALGDAFERLSASERIEALLACESLARRAQALVLRALGVLDRAQQQERGVERGNTEAEVCAALRWAPNTAQNRLVEAGMLESRFPECLDALSQGVIDWAQARALVECTMTLEDDAARAVQERVLVRMPGQSVAATRKAVRRAVVAVDPNGGQRRHVFERARRRVVFCPEADGMATLSLYTTAETGAALMAAVDRRARVCGPGDERTLDQRRADTFAALILSGIGVRFNGTQGTDAVQSAGAPGAGGEGGAAGAGGEGGASSAGSAVVRLSGTTDAPLSPSPAALVQVVVGIDTLLGSDDEPGELRGYGPITARQARELAFASGSTWRRLLTAPDGTLTHTDPHTYRPAAQVARLVRMRDRHCAFPGCAMPAARCDLDHAQPFDKQKPAEGGATVPQNLQALCRRHHRLIDP